MPLKLTIVSSHLDWRQVTVHACRSSACRDRANLSVSNCHRKSTEGCLPCYTCGIFSRGIFRGGRQQFFVTVHQDNPYLRPSISSWGRESQGDRETWHEGSSVMSVCSSEAFLFLESGSGALAKFESARGAASLGICGSRN